MSESLFDYRKATISDVDILESIRIKSIRSCTIYSPEQLAIWSRSVPNWSILIHDTLVCTERDTLIGFVVATPHLLDFLYVDPDYHGNGIANTLCLWLNVREWSAIAIPILRKYFWNVGGNSRPITSRKKTEKRFTTNGTCTVRLDKKGETIQVQQVTIERNKRYLVQA